MSGILYVQAFAGFICFTWTQEENNIANIENCDQVSETLFILTVTTHHYGNMTFKTLTDMLSSCMTYHVQWVLSIEYIVYVDKIDMAFG
mgnify:FL=1